MQPIVVDNFAGGGGASTGIEAALGRPIDYAINHDPEAIAMHRVNHPETEHLITSVWDVNPRKLAAGRLVELAWFSPDCTFHSKARGGKPFRDRNLARRRRGLAWLVPYWVESLKKNAPEVIMLENVEEFADWGPLDDDGNPDKLRKGFTFRRWVKRLENLGYAVDMRELRACDYGAPTTRKRLFVIARRDGGEIIFPDASHGPQGLEPYRTAADCIDWNVPCPSIFDRKRPLAEATMRRIARGIQRFVVDNPRPFIVPITHQGSDRVNSIDEPLRTVTTAQRGEFALVSPTIINTRNGERQGQAPRCRSIEEPLPTVTAQGSQGAVVTAFLAQHNGGFYDKKGGAGRSAEQPLSSITTKGCQQQVVKAFLVSYYGTDQSPKIDGPAPTVRTKDHLGLVTVKGTEYAIVDIGMRMLTPRELYRAQGFTDDYQIEFEHNGKPLTKTAQVRMCGNSVSPPVAEALVKANVVEPALEKRVAA